MEGYYYFMVLRYIFFAAWRHYDVLVNKSTSSVLGSIDYIYNMAIILFLSWLADEWLDRYACLVYVSPIHLYNMQLLSMKHTCGIHVHVGTLSKLFFAS